MIYNLSKPFDKQKAIERFKFLLDKKKTVELTEKKFKRTLKQNAYLHLILGWFAWEYGDTTEYVKQTIFKKIVNTELFLSEHINKNTGEIREDWRSTADLNTAEMTIAINRFRDYASKSLGLYIPKPNEKEHLKEIQIELNNNAKNYI